MKSTVSADPLEAVEHAARGIRAIATYLGIVAALSVLFASSLALLAVPMALSVCVLAWAVRSRQSRLAAVVLLVAAAIMLVRTVHGLVVTPRSDLDAGHFTRLFLTCAWFAVGVQAVVATHRFHTTQHSSPDAVVRGPRNGA